MLANYKAYYNPGQWRVSSTVAVKYIIKCDCEHCRLADPAYSEANSFLALRRMYSYICQLRESCISSRRDLAKRLGRSLWYQGAERSPRRSWSAARWELVLRSKWWILELYLDYLRITLLEEELDESCDSDKEVESCEEEDLFRILSTLERRRSDRAKRRVIPAKYKMAEMMRRIIPISTSMHIYFCYHQSPKTRA
jgi:hypothetical protein